MRPISSIHVLIPAFNEEESIGEVVSRLKSMSIHNIIVVDDGSQDQTGKKARALGCIVLTHPINLGVGAALRTGFRYAQKIGATQVVQIDADGQHSPSSIVNLLEKSECDIVVGCRNWNDYSFGFFRKGAQNALKFSLRLNGIQNISDPTSGFRLYSEESIRVLADLMPDNFLGDTVESLIISSNFGLRICSVDVEIQERFAGVPSHRGFRIVKAFIVALTYSLSHLMKRQKNVH